MDKKIDATIKKLNIKIEKVFKDDWRFFVAKGKFKTKDILLKINKNKETRETLLTEILISKKINKKFGNQFYPSYIKNGCVDGFCFLLREYIKGESLGNIFGFNYKNFLKKDLHQVVKILKKEEKINIKNLPLKKSGWYLNNFKKSQKSWSELIPQNKLEKSFIFLKERKSIIDKKITTNHGDPFPHNIIKVNKNIYFIDWGETVATNKFLDIITIWLNLWQKPSWQKEFIKNFISNKNDLTMAIFFILYKSCYTAPIIKSCRLLEENLPFLKESKKLINYYLKMIDSIINNKFKF